MTITQVLSNAKKEIRQLYYMRKSIKYLIKANKAIDRKEKALSEAYYAVALEYEKIAKRE